MIHFVKKIRYYLLGYLFVFHVDRGALKYLINKPQLSGCIARWVILLQEFTFKVLVQLGKKHVNVDHLSRLSIQLRKVSIDDSLSNATLFVMEFFSVEYANIFNYLSLHQFPNGLSEKRKKILIQKTTPYIINGGTLYKMGKDGLLCHCVSQVKIPTILKGCHVDVYGKHFASNSIGCETLLAGYWWPTLFKDAFNWAKCCDACQQLGKPMRSSSMPLVPILVQAPFEKWGIDFVEPIALTSRIGQKK